MSEKAAAAAKTGADSDKDRADGDKAARDLLLARRDTQEKAIELAVARAGAEHDKSRASDLEMRLTDMNAKQTERGDVTTPGDVLFDSNRATLRSGGLRDMVAASGRFGARCADRSARVRRSADQPRPWRGASGVDQHDAGRRQANRRVEIVLSGEDGIVKAR